MIAPITITTCASLDGVTRALIEAFVRAGQSRPLIDPRQTSAGVHALSASVANVAIVDRPARENERRPYRQIKKHEPVAVRIGFRHPDRAGRSLPGAYVAADHPLDRIGQTALGGVLTTGGAGGDVTTWLQLGVGGALGDRRIHLFGPIDDGGFATNVRLTLWPNRQFSPAYEGLVDPAAAAMSDRSSIALLDECPVAKTHGLRRLVIDRPQPPFADDPFTPSILLYLGRDDPAAIEFALFALTPPGQRSMTNTLTSPLDPTTLADTRSELLKVASLEYR